MKQLFFFSMLLCINAQAYSLQTILESLNATHKVKSQKLHRDSQVIQNSMISSYDAPVFGVGVAHAKDPSDEGLEYSLGISQDISNPFSSSSKENARINLDAKVTEETRKRLQSMKLELVSSYHTTCVSKEMRNSIDILYQEQESRYEQLNNAYLLGEISKKDLYFNKLDLAKLKQKSISYKRVYKQEFAQLQAKVDNLVLDDISCEDLSPLQRKIQMKDLEEHSDLKVISYKQNVAQSFSSLHDSYIPTLGYEFNYEKELDTKRYTFGLNIPLSGLTSKQESLKSSELSLLSSYNEEKQAVIISLQSDIKGLEWELESLFDELVILEKEILPLSSELLTFSRLSIQEGEGNMMEYIDSSRSYSENLLEMLELKKLYYNKLFELYKVADLDYSIQ